MEKYGYIPNIGGEFMTNSKEAEDLKKALERAKIGLETARNHFQYAQDAELVDYYTYVMIANEK